MLSISDKVTFSQSFRSWDAVPSPRSVRARIASLLTSASRSERKHFFASSFFSKDPRDGNLFRPVLYRLGASQSRLACSYCIESRRSWSCSCRKGKGKGTYAMRSDRSDSTEVLRPVCPCSECCIPLRLRTLSILRARRAPSHRCEKGTRIRIR